MRAGRFLSAPVQSTTNVSPTLQSLGTALTSALEKMAGRLQAFEPSIPEADAGSHVGGVWRVVELLDFSESRRAPRGSLGMRGQVIRNNVPKGTVLVELLEPLTLLNFRVLPDKTRTRQMSRQILLAAVQDAARLLPRHAPFGVRLLNYPTSDLA